MPLTKRVAIITVVLIGTLCGGGYSQTATTSEGVTVTIPEIVFTYVDTVASHIGQGILYGVKAITGEQPGYEFEEPIGYLGLVTLILLIFSIIKLSRMIIWIGIIAGWTLLILRIILDTLHT